MCEPRKCFLVTYGEDLFWYAAHSQWDALDTHMRSHNLDRFDMESITCRECSGAEVDEVVIPDDVHSDSPDYKERTIRELVEKADCTKYVATNVC